MPKGQQLRSLDHVGCAHDGLDRPALPRVPSSDDAPGAALYGDADDGRHHSWRSQAAAWLRCAASIRWRCSSAAPIPRDLATAAKIGEDFGYDEINLNVGCPSDRVKDGRFGACLMAEPALVAEGVAAMKRAVKIPVTVKCRIGIDDQDPEVALDDIGARRHRGGRGRADRARPQGLAQRIVAEGKPRYPAARLRPGLSAEGRDARRAHHHQWRHRQPCGRRSSISLMSMA